MKKIALVMDGWKRSFTYAWPAGILRRIRETGEDINLYVFRSAADWSKGKDYNVGEFNIYNLPDFKDFDGIILDLDNNRHKEVGLNLIEAVRASGKPAISISNDIDGFFFVGIDNYVAMKDMIAHLYEEHHCRKFWFIMGSSEHYENNRRAKALKDYMKEKGLDYSADVFYFESYEYQCGSHGFVQLLEKHSGEVPDAIVCANDNIAVGVCESAAVMGYEVPRDFCVTGFDNFDKASYYMPKITTVSHTYEDIGYCCADLLIKLWNGEDVSRFHYTETESIFWESCGCQLNKEVDVRKHIKDKIMYELETEEFEDQVLFVQYELLNCESVQEMAKLIPKCIPIMRCDAVYLVLDDHLNDFKRQKDYYGQLLLDEERFHIHSYPSSMNVVFAYEDNEDKSQKGQTIESLFPLFEHDKSGTDFLFMPLHFKNYTVGFLVIRNAMYIMEKQYLYKVVNVLTTALENLHEKERLKYMNQVLMDMSIKDSMTGLFNRLGYQQLARRLFERKKSEKKNLLIMFVDMDRLKYINDYFGHEYGDSAIKIISSAILKHCNYDEIPIRMGGDEFLIIHDLKSEHEIEEMIADMRWDVETAAKEKELPFPLSFSIGCIKTDMNSDKNLDDYIREADVVMYEEKMRKKANRKE